MPLGVTLRLWIDPEAPAHGARLLLARCGPSGPQDMPRPRSSSRDARPARGVPPRDRRSVRPRLRARGDAESVHPVQRRVSVRRTARFARRAGASPAGHRSLRTRRANTAEGCCWRGRPTRRRTSRTCSPGSTRPCSSGLVPARRADEGRDAGGGGASGAGSSAAAGEPGSVLPRRRRLSRVPRAARAVGAAEGPIVDAAGESSAGTTATGGSPRASGAGSASPPVSRCTR